MAGSTRGGFWEDPARFPRPRFLWRLIAWIGDALAAPALPATVQEPRTLIERACMEAVGESVWGPGQPCPTSALIDLELPGGPAYDALSAEDIEDAARKATRGALVDRFGRGAEQCGLAVAHRRGVERLAAPRAHLRLVAASRRPPTIMRAVIAMDYLDSRRYPWQEVVLERVDRITIGTDEDNNLRILPEAAQGASKFHCWAEVVDGKLMVHDGQVIEDRANPGAVVVLRPASTNGTALEGRLLPNPRAAAEWPEGGRLVLAPVRHMPDRPANTPRAQGMTLWLLKLDLNEEELRRAA